MAVAMNAGAFRGVHAVEAGGAATESTGGVAVIVLAILSLVGVIPRILVPVSGIVFGVAFMIEGAALAARQASLIEGATSTTGATGTQNLEVGGSVTIELAVGAAAIVLGILSLIGVVPGILMPALITTAGAGLILSAGWKQRLSEVQSNLATSETPTQGATQGATVANIATGSAAGAQFLAGIAVTVLGIVGLTGAGVPMLMSAVGLLVLGCAITLSGTALASRMLRLVQGR